MNGGIIFDEGTVWKKKRKILNQVFNFKFVSGFFEDIKRITVETLDELELRNNEGDELKLCIREIGDTIFSRVTIEGFIGGSVSKERLKNRLPG